ncbi:MAG TPA: cell division protein ZapE [Gammaproteobacteria bacterium]|nr:cell division protein ZapE [Gammaproteobacteria bacterium]
MNSITPLDYYQNKSREGIISPDPEQLAALQQLQSVYENLLVEYQKRNGLFSFFHQPHLIKGLYLWGGVGIGKTFLMDCFYECLPVQKKMRMHFHQFMKLVHQQLKKYQGEKNPLELVAKDVSKKAIVLCFDELFVSDITDAMLLGHLFRALFQRGVCLVTTSNTAPDDLYKNGLQREQFLPAIALLKENTTVWHIPTTLDYRLRHLQEAGVFYSPLNDDAREKMEKSFTLLAKGHPISTDPVMILDRPIRIKKRAGKTIWFDFADLCQVPRSQNDYLAIAEQFQTVFISDIPVIPENAKDTICLFISMVDVFYDARVRLVISAAEPVAEIYSRGYMVLEYTRTHSRLLEMQSTDYFSAES